MGLRDIIKNLTVQNKNDPTRGHSLNNQLIYYSIIVKGGGVVEDLLLKIDNIFELEIKKPVPKADSL